MGQLESKFAMESKSDVSIELVGIIHVQVLGEELCPVPPLRLPFIGELGMGHSVTAANYFFRFLAKDVLVGIATDTGIRQVSTRRNH